MGDGGGASLIIGGFDVGCFAVPLSVVRLSAPALNSSTLIRFQLSVVSGLISAFQLFPQHSIMLFYGKLKGGYIMDALAGA